MTLCRFCGQPNEPGTRFCANPACGMYQWDGEDVDRGPAEPPPPQRSPARPPGAFAADAAGAASAGAPAGGPSGRGTGGGTAAAVEDRPPPQPSGQRVEDRPPLRPSGRSTSSGRGGRIAVAISLPRTELAVEPPNLATCEVIVRNTGALVDQFSLTLEGPAAQWGTIEPAAINLYPESEAITALVSFQPPRSPDTPAGPALFMVRATSREDPSVSATAAGVLVVGAYLDVTTGLVPQTSRGKRGGAHELTLSNRGNGPVTATLLASDPDKQLSFSADPPLLEVEPGGDAVSRIEVAPRKRVWVGKPKTMPFMVGAQVGAAPPIRADGRHEQLPVIPSWVVKLAAVIVVPLVALAVWLLTTARIPPVVGATRAVAEERLTGAGFDPEFKNLASLETPAGSIVSTEPARGGRILKSTEVTAFVSAGPNPIEVPDVRGLDAGVARAQLLAAGLTARSVEGDDEAVGPGQVFATEPPSGEVLPPEAQVVMSVRPGGDQGSGGGLGDAGPVDPTTGFPAYYSDATASGLRLELCLDGNPVCATGREAFVASPPDGTAHYWSAEILPFSSPLNGGPITFRSALVAAFGATGEPGCVPRSCAERTYSVIEVTAAEGTLRPETTYEVTHPFGTSNLTTDENGAITPMVGREEVGCISNPPQECDWNAVKEGRVGPFLVWDPQTLPSAPPGYIGDRLTPHRVTGSSLGTNFVRIAGPELGASGLATEEFLVEGKVSTSSAPPPGQAGAAPSEKVVTASPQRAGVPSAPIPVKFTNNGSGNLVVTDVQVSGEGNDDWSLVSQNCTGQPIPAGGSCDVMVSVNPSAGGPTNGKVTIFSNAFGGPMVIGLSGNGQAPNIDPPPGVDFGNGATNVVSPAKSVVITNSGSADLMVSGAELAGNDPGDFVLTSNGCRAKVAPGQSCEIKLAFRPLDGGTRSAVLSIVHNAPLDGSTLDVPITGTGQAPSARIGPAQLVFASFDTNPGIVTISNQGTSPLKVLSYTILGPADAFKTTGQVPASQPPCQLNMTLGSGDGCAIAVTFNPQFQELVACAQGTLAVTTDDPKARQLSVNLIGSSALAQLNLDLTCN